MSGKPSANMIRAMNFVLAGVTPYTSAVRAGIAPGTMYRSRLYKMWQRGDLAELKRELDTERPVKRTVKLIGKKRFLPPKS
jgi:hypothetical protein